MCHTMPPPREVKISLTCSSTHTHTVPVEEVDLETCTPWFPREHQDICEREGVVQALEAATHASRHITSPWATPCYQCICMHLHMHMYAYACMMHVFMYTVVHRVEVHFQIINPTNLAQYQNISWRKLLLCLQMEAITSCWDVKVSSKGKGK